jgi:hypothetical protein
MAVSKQTNLAKYLTNQCALTTYLRKKELTEARRLANQISAPVKSYLKTSRQRKRRELMKTQFNASDVVDTLTPSCIKEACDNITTATTTFQNAFMNVDASATFLKYSILLGGAVLQIARHSDIVTIITTLVTTLVGLDCGLDLIKYALKNATDLHKPTSPAPPASPTPPGTSVFNPSPLLPPSTFLTQSPEADAAIGFSSILDFDFTSIIKSAVDHTHLLWSIVCTFIFLMAGCLFAIPHMEIRKNLPLFMSAFKRTVDGFKAVQEVATWAVKFIQNQFYKYFYGVTREEYQLIQVLPKFEAFTRGVRVLQTLPGDAFMTSRDLCLKVKELYQLQQECETKLVKNNKIIPKESSILFYHVARNFLPIYDTAKKSPHFDDISRAKPQSCYLYGHSGVGKSQFVNLATAVIAKRLYPDRPLSSGSVLWTRRPENEFWDGYANQPFVQYDDFLQQIDTVTKPNPEIMEVINLVNDAPYQLHMAELSQKNSSYFTSDHVWVSTNTKTPKPVSIVCSDALRRRFDNTAYEVTVNAAYGKEVKIGTDTFHRLDPSKTNSCLDTRVWTLYAYDIATGRQIYDDNAKAVSYSFDQFIDYYCKEWEKARVHHANKAAKINEILGAKPDSKADVVKAALDILNEPMRTEGPNDSIHDMMADTSLDEPILYATNLPSLDLSPTEIAEATDGVKDYFEHMELKFSHLTSKELIQVFNQGATSKAALQAAIDKITQDRQNELQLTRDRIERDGVDFTSNVDDLPDFVEPESTWKAYFQACYIKSRDLATVNFNKGMTKLRAKITSIASTFKRHPYITAFAGAISALLFALAAWKLAKSECRILDRRGAFRMLCKPGCPDCDVVRQTCGSHLNIDFSEFREAIFEYNIAAYKILQTQGSTEEIRVGAKVQFDYWQQIFEATLAPQISRPQRSRYRNGNSNVFRQSVEGYTRPPTFKQSVEGYTKNSIPKMVVQITPELANMECQVAGVTTNFYDFLLTNVNDSAIQQVLNPLVSNTCVLRMKGRAAIGMFVEGRVLLCPQHYMPWIEAEGGFNLCNMFADSPGQWISIKDCKVTPLKSGDKDTDAMLITCPLSVPSRVKISNKFIDATQLPLVCESEVSLCRVRLVNDRPVLLIDSAPSSAHEEVKAVDDKGTTHTARNAYSYPISTSAGDCGCIVVSRSQRIARKIIGIHVSGNGKVGVASSVTREMLQTGLAKQPERYLTSLPDMQTEIPTDTYKDDFEHLTDVGDVIHHGYFPNHPHQPTKSDIKPSPLQAVISPACKPARLAPTVVDEEGNRRDPLLKGLKKIAGTQADVSDDLLDRAANDVFNLLKGLSGDLEPRVLTYEEAIAGVDDDEYINGLIRKTSPGFPWTQTQTKGFPGKTTWLSKTDEDGKLTDDYCTDNPELKAAVEARIEAAKNNERHPTFYVATLKDERRPKAKVDDLKTRVFTAAPMDFTITCRKYFGDFIADCMHNRIDNEIIVGLDSNTEWDLLAKVLLAFGDGGFVAGDFGNFDGSLLQKVLWVALDIINRWYNDSEENQRVRRVLFEECCNALVICRGHVIQWTHSQPSGNPMTTFINSLFQMIMFRVCYLTAKIENGMPPVCDFRENVTMVTYGDDGVLNVHPRMRSIFNQQTITAYMKQFGLNYTNEAKNDTVYTLRDLKDVSLLKRGFLHLNGQWIAPLDLDTIVEMTLWTKGPLPRVACVENVHNAFRELTQHGPDVYNSVSRYLTDACWRVGIRVFRPTYVEMLDERLAHINTLREVPDGLVVQIGEDDSGEDTCGPVPLAEHFAYYEQTAADKLIPDECGCYYEDDRTLFQKFREAYLSYAAFCDWCVMFNIALVATASLIPSLLLTFKMFIVSIINAEFVSSWNLNDHSTLFYQCIVGANLEEVFFKPSEKLAFGFMEMYIKYRTHGQFLPIFILPAIFHSSLQFVDDVYMRIFLHVLYNTTCVQTTTRESVTSLLTNGLVATLGTPKTTPISTIFWTAYRSLSRSHHERRLESFAREVELRQFFELVDPSYPRSSDWWRLHEQKTETDFSLASVDCNSPYHCTDKNLHFIPGAIVGDFDTWDLEEVASAWCFLNTAMPELIDDQDPDEMISSVMNEEIDIWDDEWRVIVTFHFPYLDINVIRHSYNHWFNDRVLVDVEKPSCERISYYVPNGNKPYQSASEQNPRVNFVMNIEDEHHDATWVTPAAFLRKD